MTREATAERKRKEGMTIQPTANERLRESGGLHLVTRGAGFIGYHTCERLLGAGQTEMGLDNLNGYYDPALKQTRLDRLSRWPVFELRRVLVTEM